MSDSTAIAPVKTGVQAFTFGDPSPVLDSRDFMDYIIAYRNGKWFEPPVSLEGLAKSFRSTPYQSSAIYVKRNILTSMFKPHRLLSRAAFERWAFDQLVFGNSYLERTTNRLGQTLALKP